MNSIQWRYTEFVVDETPYCLLDWDLRKRSLDFIESIDPHYFEHIATLNGDLLSGEERQYAALSLRMAYSQGLEALFSLLGAAIQAPHCVPGWLIRYKPKELYGLIQKIDKHSHILTGFKLNPPSWQKISKVINLFSIKDKNKENSLKERFGQLWGSFAKDFLNSKFGWEYNCMKHGLRIKTGGFRLDIGIEKEPGVPAPPEAMQTIGKSDFGSTFFIPEKIHAGYRPFRIRRYSRNWNPENLIHGLNLISMSMNNIISFLKIFNKTKEKPRFVWPKQESYFNEPWKKLVGAFEFGYLEPILNRDSVKKFSKEEILSVYKVKK